MPDCTSLSAYFRSVFLKSEFLIHLGEFLGSGGDWETLVVHRLAFLFCDTVLMYFNWFRDPVNDCLRNVKDRELLFFR